MNIHIQPMPAKELPWHSCSYLMQNYDKSMMVAVHINGISVTILLKLHTCSKKCCPRNALSLHPGKQHPAIRKTNS